MINNQLNDEFTVHSYKRVYGCDEVKKRTFYRILFAGLKVRIFVA
jgi:hypothetical protein